ncbi:MAG: hypothetical protein ABI191_06185 [Rhizomicrobium sp.]
MIAVISFIHDLLFHAVLRYRARDANDVPGNGCAKQRGFRCLCATFGLESAVKAAVSSARNTGMSTIYATAALLGISDNVLTTVTIAYQRKARASLNARARRQTGVRYQNNIPTSSITRS